MHHLLKTAANMIPRLQKWFQWEFWVHRWAAIVSRIIIVGCVGCRRDCCYDVFVLLVVNDEWWVMSDECDEVNQHVWWIALDFILIPSSTDLHFVTRFTPPVIPRFAPHSTKNVAAFGNFFMLWGEPVLGAKKEREKKEKSSLVWSSCINTTKKMQRIPTILLKWRLYDLIKHNQHPKRFKRRDVRVENAWQYVF